MNYLAQQRADKQPINMPSAGSTLKDLLVIMQEN